MGHPIFGGSQRGTPALRWIAKSSFTWIWRTILFLLVGYGRSALAERKLAAAEYAAAVFTNFLLEIADIDLSL